MAGLVTFVGGNMKVYEGFLDKVVIHDSCCQGHTEHDLIKTNTFFGEMFIYDAAKYHQLPDHGLTCYADDAVSRTLTTGVYEFHETLSFLNILSQNQTGLVLDFGSHVGWYSMIAAKAGHRVIAFEANSERLDILKKNAELNSVNNLITTNNCWVNGDSKELEINEEVLVLKCDLEGAEEHVIRMCKPLLEKNMIKYLLLEISPCINDSYPVLLKYLYSLGYKAIDVCRVRNGVIKFEEIDSWLGSIKQENLLFFKDEK